MDNFFYIDLSYCTKRQSLVIVFIADMMIIFIMTYFLLNSPLCSVLHILFLEAATENCSLK